MTVPSPEQRDDLYTAGELAKLFDIPKQTLLYYDKMGLIEPEFITDNSYRHYTIKQYMILEIITNLRKLDIPINIIKNYLENRNLDYFEKLINDKQRECDEIIKKNMEIKDNLELARRKIDNIKNTQCDNFSLEFRQTRKFYITPLHPQDTPRNRIDSYAEHNLFAYAHHHFKECSTGWSLSTKDFFEGNFAHNIYYYSPLSQEFDDERNIPPDQLHLRPAGLYLTLRCHGTFHNCKERVLEMFKSFLERNNLEVVGDVYVQPLKDHWMSTSPESYIVQISIGVQYKK